MVFETVSETALVMLFHLLIDVLKDHGAVYCCSLCCITVVCTVPVFCVKCQISAYFTKRHCYYNPPQSSLNVIRAGVRGGSAWQFPGASTRKGC
jgi:hypothetical protein